MRSELTFIALLRSFAAPSTARDLLDDAAVLPFGSTSLVLTTDLIAEGVHFLPDDPPEDVAWKLVGVNLSDLAAKGARPLGVLLGYPLGEDAWDRAFVAGLGAALAAYDAPLLGGDTVRPGAGGPRTLSLTAIGEAAVAPSRAGARPGDDLWVSGSIGDAGAGLALLRAGAGGDPHLIARYRRPEPRLALGRALAPLVSAMMDVSDGLLIDASRIAEASGVRVAIALEAVPLSAELLTHAGDGLGRRIGAATAGDDYELLFAAGVERRGEIAAVAAACGMAVSRIGRVGVGGGLALSWFGEAVEMPERLGWLHG